MGVNEETALFVGSPFDVGSRAYGQGENNEEGEKIGVDFGGGIRGTALRDHSSGHGYRGDSIGAHVTLAPRGTKENVPLSAQERNAKRAFGYPVYSATSFGQESEKQWSTGFSLIESGRPRFRLSPHLVATPRQ